MDEDYSAGFYTVNKRFRSEEYKRHQKDIPWTKQVLDLDHNKFFLRTPWEWLRLLGFYMFLYLCIAIICGACCLIFYFFVIPKGKPLILKEFPGISSVPSSSRTIGFRPDIHEEVYKIADVIDKFIDNLDEYGEAEERFETCNYDQLWGYSSKEPCIFVKINKIIGFSPETYDTVQELPKESPKSLEKTMSEHKGKGKIWITCECLTAGIKSPQFDFIPKPYFDATTDLQGVDRVVAVKLKNLAHNEDVDIMCTVWAKNIPIDVKISGRGNIKLTLNMLVI